MFGNGMKWLVWGWAVAVSAAAAHAALAPGHQELEHRLAEVAAIPGEPGRLDTVGITRGDVPIRSLEAASEVGPGQRRLIVLAGLDGDDRGVDAALAALRWFKMQAPAELRRTWSITAIPCGNPEGWVRLKPTNDYFGKPTVNYPPADGYYNDVRSVENRYLWRWITFQGPDLVLDFRGGNRTAWTAPATASALLPTLVARPLLAVDSLAMALGKPGPAGFGTVPAVVVETRAAEGPRALEQCLVAARGLPRSPLRLALESRLARKPMDVAVVLAKRYPQKPAITYISATALRGALRLGQLTRDPSWRERVVKSLDPWLSGAQESLDDKPDGVKLAGHAAFAALALDDVGSERGRALALTAADRFRPEAAAGTARFSGSAVEDIFMLGSLLPLTDRLDPAREDRVLLHRTLSELTIALQTEDGLFRHSRQTEVRWGRGNGFAALGMAEALAGLPDGAARTSLLRNFRRQMAALKLAQAPDGTWRQIIDKPESYREYTATAMILAAMARGVRLKWLPADYRATVSRAWNAVSARTNLSGELIDVCEGTGPGPSVRYYLDRRALEGGDDRGGAMGLTAALEMAELTAG